VMPTALPLGRLRHTKTRGDKFGGRGNRLLARAGLKR